MFVFRVGAVGVEPRAPTEGWSLRLIRTPLSPPELRASESRAGGSRTHTLRIKSPLCCQLHHNPMIGWAYAFQSQLVQHRLSPRICISSGSPGNRTQRHPVISRVRATSPRLPSSRAPRSRTETLLLPKQACSHLHLHPIVCQSERQDLNLRSRGPRPRAITRLRYVLISSSPCGSRTQPARLERPMTSPEVERAVLCALIERRVGLTVLEPVSPGLQPGALPSKLPTQQKNPMPCDTGLRLIPWWIDQVSQAQRHRGQRICRLKIGKRP